MVSRVFFGFLFICLIIFGLPKALSSDSARDVYVSVHEGTSIENVRWMLEDLHKVDGIALNINLYDNTTNAINDAINRLRCYLGNFSDYKIIIQAIYVFPYGYVNNSQWKYPIGCFTEQFYNQWYGSLSKIFINYPNVILFVGFNEAYFHFQNKEDAKLVMQREYLVWKNKSRIPFSCEFTFPFPLWFDYFNVTINFEEDILPIWQNYSDYIGVNMIPYTFNPNYGHDSLGSERLKFGISNLKHYSELYGKPVHINELLCWYVDDVQNVFENLPSDSKIVIYKLWDEIDSDEAIYALYNVNLEKGNITRVSPTWQVYNNVFNQQESYTSNSHKSLTFAFILIIFICCVLLLSKFFKSLKL